MADMEMRVLASRPTAGGNEKLVETQCGEYLVVNQEAGKIRLLLIFDTPAAAWRAWRDNEAESVHHHREPCSACGAALPGLACP